MSPFSTRARRIWLMIGTCSIPTGQISTQAMHCMHDQSVSDLMVPRICACSGNSGAMPSAARFPIEPSATSRRSSTRSRGESG